MVRRASGLEPANHWDRDMDLDTADFRIYKGVENRIEFILRNTDRKPVHLMGRTVRIVFTDRYTGEVLANPLVRVVDEQRGSCVLTLSRSLTQEWPEGALTYAALLEEANGDQFLLFADHGQRATAFCFVSKSPIQVSTQVSTQIYHFPLVEANEIRVRRIQLVKDGVGLNTTGYTFTMQIRAGQSPTADLLQTLKDGDGLEVITEGSNVYLELKIGPFPGVTTRIDAYYDLLASKDGETRVWLEGTIPIEPGITS